MSDMDQLVDQYFDLLREIKEDGKKTREKRKTAKQLEQDIVSIMVEKKLSEYTSESNQVFIKPTLSNKK